MPQTNIGMYLSLISWFVLIFVIYYIFMKSYILTRIYSKLYIKSLPFPSLKLICFRSPNSPYFPIFLD